MATATQSDPIPTSAAHLTCLCGAIDLPGTYLADTHFPVKSEICHCNPCRQTLSTLLPLFPSLATPPPPTTLSLLTTYQFTSVCIRYFCTVCGTHCFVSHPQTDPVEWYCTDGVIDFPAGSDEGLRPVDVVEVKGHAFVGDTGDGGVVPLFALRDQAREGEEEEGEVGEVYDAVSGGERIGVEELRGMVEKSLNTPTPGVGERLEAKCHCGDVCLSIERADHDGRDRFGVKERMVPPDKGKYHAWYCVCRSCRLASGTGLQAWSYVPPGAIWNGKTGEKVVLGREVMEEGEGGVRVNEGLGVKWYMHTEEAMRGFCGRCGVTVFYVYVGKEEGDGVVDVSVGVLRAESGAMAREWLWWKEGHISHREEGVNRSVEEVIARGWRAIGLEQKV